MCPWLVRMTLARTYAMYSAWMRWVPKAVASLAVPCCEPMLGSGAGPGAGRGAGGAGEDEDGVNPLGMGDCCERVFGTSAMTGGGGPILVAAAAGWSAPPPARRP